MSKDQSLPPSSSRVESGAAAIAEDLPEGQEWTIREAVPGDVSAICQLVKALAEHIGSENEVVINEELLEAALFGDDPVSHVLVAVMDQRVVGYASWFRSFSTWPGRVGIYLEDLFVSPEARGLGMGAGLIRALTRAAVDRGYGRLEWTVVTSNVKAQRFYRNMGGLHLPNIQTWRMSLDRIETFVDQEATRLPLEEDNPPDA